MTAEAVSFEHGYDIVSIPLANLAPTKPVDLPLEILDMVYGYVIDAGPPTKFDAKMQKLVNLSGLLHVNREISHNFSASPLRNSPAMVFPVKGLIFSALDG